MENYLIKYKLTEACFLLFGQSFSHSVKFAASISLDEIKRAYRRKAKIYHPDMVSKNEESIKLGAMIFNKLTNAYRFLLEYKNENNNNIVNKEPLTKEQRKSYDNFIHKNFVNDFYYKGELPYRQLRFGEFLFYSKVISWRTLIKAIMEQYKKRPRLGEICIEQKILNSYEIREIIRQIKPGEKFGDAAVRLNYLSIYQLFAVLGMQKKSHWPIGRYFTEKEIISNEKLYGYFISHKEHNFKVKLNKKK